MSIGKRTKEVKVRLSEMELAELNKKATSCKCSREKFLRLVLSEVSLKAPPPLEYYQLIKEFNAIGNNLNQLVKLAYVSEIDKTQLEDVLSKLDILIKVLDKQIRGYI